jgi:hypothetical protein
MMSTTQLARWKLTNDGTYSTSSAYKTQIEGIIATPYHDIIWIAWVPPISCINFYDITASTCAHIIEPSKSGEWSLSWECAVRKEMPAMIMLVSWEIGRNEKQGVFEHHAMPSNC